MESKIDKMTSLNLVILIIAGLLFLFQIFLLIITTIYLIRNFKRLTFLWIPHLIFTISLIELLSAIIAKNLFSNMDYFYQTQSSLFICMNIKLVIHLIISILILFSSQGRVSLLIIQIFVKILVLILSLLLHICFIGLGLLFFQNKGDMKLWIFIFCGVIILLNFLMQFLITRSSRNLKTHIDIALKISLIDCLWSIMTICFIVFGNNSYYIIIFGLLGMFLYSYFVMQLLLKIDFFEYYEEYRKKNIFDNLLWLKKLFFLDNFLSEYSELSDTLIKRKSTISTQQSKIESSIKQYNKSKEFVYFNFCVLSEIYEKKLKEFRNREVRFIDSSSLSINESPKTESVEIKFIKFVDKYFDHNIGNEENEIRFANYINYFSNDKIDQKNLKITSYENNEFLELVNTLGVSYRSVTEALNPKKNTRICFNIESKLELNLQYNEFYSYDCFISYEIYEYNNLSKVNTILKDYFLYFKSNKNNFKKSYLPLIIGCFEIEYLNQHYIIIVYRNPYAFSTFHDMKHFFIMSIDNIEKKVIFTSNPQFQSNIVSNNELEIMNEIYLQDDDYINFKNNLERDMNFLLKSKIKHNLNIFIMNDIFNQNSGKFTFDNKTNDRVSARFDFSVLDRLSENESNKKFITTTLSCFEELFIIKYSRNSRYIIKIYFSNMFSDLDEEIDYTEYNLK